MVVSGLEKINESEEVENVRERCAAFSQEVQGRKGQ